MILSAKNNSKTRYNVVESSQSEQGDKVNLLLLSASMIFLINATVGLIVVYPNFYVIGNEKCTCNREAFKERLKGKHYLSINSCKLILKLCIRTLFSWIIPFPVRGNGNNHIYPLLSTRVNTWTELEAFNEYKVLFFATSNEVIWSQKTTTTLEYSQSMKSATEKDALISSKQFLSLPRFPKEFPKHSQRNQE